MYAKYIINMQNSLSIKCNEVYTNKSKKSKKKVYNIIINKIFCISGIIKVSNLSFSQWQRKSYLQEFNYRIIKTS